MEIKNFKLLESFGLKDGEYISYTYHFDRLQKSAVYFDFNIQINKIHDLLHLIRRNHPHGHFKIRLLVNHKAELEWGISKINPFVDKLKVTLAEKSIDRSNVFLYHKTTLRSMYENAKKGHNEFFDVLLWNENEELTEFTIGNLVCEINQTLYTPPIDSGLLAGTFREELLMNEIIKVKTMYKKDLHKIDKLWLINSVREWVEVELALDSSGF